MSYTLLCKIEIPDKLLTIFEAVTCLNKTFK